MVVLMEGIIVLWQSQFQVAVVSSVPDKGIIVATCVGNAVHGVKERRNNRGMLTLIYLARFKPLLYVITYKSNLLAGQSIEISVGKVVRHVVFFLGSVVLVEIGRASCRERV